MLKLSKKNCMSGRKNWKPTEKKDEIAQKAGEVFEKQKDAEIALMDADTALGGDGSLAGSCKECIDGSFKRKGRGQRQTAAL